MLPEPSLPPEAALTEEAPTEMLRGSVGPSDGVGEFEVDDSTRSLVEGLLSAEPARLPEPHPDHYEEHLWTDEDLPDDGTVEFIADGATSTPRAIGWEDTGAEVSVPSRDTMVEPTGNWDDQPTDPPIPAEGGVPRVLRLEYRSTDRLAKDLAENLRRGSSFVATDSPLAAGVECVLEYYAPGLQAPLSLSGVVTWSTATSSSLLGQPPGMDVEYRIEGGERLALERNLQRLSV